jgi:dihydroxyacetone kinase-like protein
MASKIYECIEKIGNRIIEEKEFLTELDREIGDADHGINMARGFTEVLGILPKDSDNIGELLKKTGMTLLSKVGGASGPLYGTAYMQAGKVCAGKTALTPEDGKAIFEAVIAGIQKRGKAVKGEKTMLDAIIPGYEAYCAAADAGKDLAECLDAMCAAAAEGVEYTKTIIATKGRASYLGERSIGHQDPGATSSLLTMEAIRDWVRAL